LQASGVQSNLFTAAFADTRYAQPYNESDLAAAYESGSVVILAGGTGKPGLSTDTASVQLATALKVDAILKATHTVDGVYTADPTKDPRATKLDELPYAQALSDQLSIMDNEALRQASDAHIPTIVFSIKDPTNLTKVLAGETIGSRITPHVRRPNDFH